MLVDSYLLVSFPLLFSGYRCSHWRFPLLLFLVCLSFRIVVLRDLGFPPPGGISCMFCLGICFCNWLLPPAILLWPWILCLLGFLWVCPCILPFFLVPIVFCFPSCVLPCFSPLLFLFLPWILRELPFCTLLWIIWFFLHPFCWDP